MDYTHKLSLFDNKITINKIIRDFINDNDKVQQSYKDILLDNKDMLFYDKIILVEGSNDKLFLSAFKKWLNKITNSYISIKLVSVGGKDKIIKFYRAIDDKSLSFKFLFDNDFLYDEKDDNDNNNKNYTINKTYFSYIKDKYKNINENNYIDNYTNIMEKILTDTENNIIIWDNRYEKMKSNKDDKDDKDI